MHEDKIRLNACYRELVYPKDTVEHLIEVLSSMKQSVMVWGAVSWSFILVCLALTITFLANGFTEGANVLVLCAFPLMGYAIQHARYSSVEGLYDWILMEKMCGGMVNEH